MGKPGIATIALSGTLISCGGNQAPAAPPTQPAPPPTTPAAVRPAPDSTPSFDEDLTYLGRHGEIHVLRNAAGSVVAVSPKYQGRVMTSSVAPDGPSLGWIHRRFVEDGKTGTQFDNYGGEDRFWLGPEGGQFGLYFPPGKPFTFDHWQTPAAFQEGEWSVVSKSDTEIKLRQPMVVSNNSGTVFHLDVVRTIEILDTDTLVSHYRALPGAGARYVAYQTINEVTNTGDRAWNKTGGLPSIWILAMYPPSDDTVVIVPYEKAGTGSVVNDEYFGKVPSDRLVVDPENGVILFRCDGEHRSKIGLTPQRARSALGSYSASARLLTVVKYNGPVQGSPYVNSMWEQQKEPYAGDVVNSYNDGPTEPGKPALGGFYEIETSSPGLELAPGATFRHVHRTLHVVGEESELDPVAKAELGIPLSLVGQKMPPK